MLHLRSQSEIDIEVKFDEQSKTLLNQLIKEKGKNSRFSWS